MISLYLLLITSVVSARNSFEALVEENPKILQGSLAELRAYVEYGNPDFSDTIIPFSDSPLKVSLAEPRIPVSRDPKLFYAAIPRLDKTVDFEFSAWDHDDKKYDFGKVVGFGTPQARIESVDEAECFRCHRTRGPIVNDRPWLNFTGANAPIGTILSFAVLARQMELDPRKYGKYDRFVRGYQGSYDRSFGNLVPEFAIALGPVEFHGTSIFKLRGGFDFDANVRRGHYLSQTYAIWKALPPSQRAPYVREFIERGITSWAKPQEVATLFSWNQWIEKWKAEVDFKQDPVLANSPIFENFVPNFDYPELIQAAGLDAKQIEADPVAATLKINALIERGDFLAYPPEQRASNPKIFIDMRPNHNGGASTGLGLVLGLRKEDLQALRERQRTQDFAVYFASSAWQRWIERQERFPDREALMHQIFGGQLASRETAKPAALAVRTRRGPVQWRFSAEALSRHACLSCHANPTGVTPPLDWDPLDPAEWNARLGANATPEAARLAKAVLKHIEAGTMPPEPLPGWHPRQAQPALDAIRRAMTSP